MTIALHAVSAQLLAASGTYPLDWHEQSGGRLTLDEGWAPYGQATLDIAMPSAEALVALDPRDNPRVQVTATRDVPAFGVHQTRDFDFLLRERQLDHVTATAQLTLSTDEGLLQDYALVASASDTSALARQTSVRDIVNSNVLARIGAALQPGTEDADFTTLTEVTNLILNPSVEVNANEWAAGGGCTIARVTTQHYQGVASIAATATNVSCAVFANNTSTYMPATAGKTYTGSMWALPNAAGMSMAVTVRYLDASNNTLLNATGTVQALPTSGWSRVRSATSVAPANTARMALYASISGTAAGRVTYLDGALLVEGDGLDTSGQPLEYFDGSTPDTALYNYQWSAAANASTSSRVPVFQRDPQALWWEPGESAWAFITPVLQQSQLRLFCDEQRRWWLVDSSYSVAGRITVAEGYNAYAATDLVSRTATADDGTPLWFDAVVLKYVWNDINNVQQVRYDVASVPEPTQVFFKEIDRPFPGPGVASYYLARVSGQGRTLDLTAAFDLAATPGMEAVASLPFTPAQTGYASSVIWDFGADEMQIGTRGLTDTPPSAWVFLEPGESWLDSPVGASWISETV